MTRFYGVPLRNSLGLGLGGVISLGGAYDPDFVYDNLELEDGADILLEDGGLILLEGLMPTLWLDFQYSTSLDSRITFTRASTATYFNNLGVLTTAGSGVPRFDYNPSTLQPRGLLIEEQRTNSIRNNTMQGAVAGTPGTAPTNWTASVVTTTGLTTSVVGTGTESGITYIDLNLAGTASGAGSFTVQFEANGIITASSGQTWAGSVYWKIAGGSYNGLSGGALRVDERAGGFLATKTLVNADPTTAALSSQRISGSAALTNASTTNIVPYIRFSIANGAAIDITLRIGLPQLELGAFATSVIPTTTTALTRNADVASMTGTNFSSWYNQTEGSFVANGVSFGGAVAGLYSASNGTSAQSVSVRLQQQFSFAQGLNRASFTYTTNSIARHGFAYKANDYAAAFNGTALTISAQPTDVPTTANVLNIGTLETGAFSLNGWIQRIAYYPTRLPNATLQVLTT